MRRSSESSVVLQSSPYMAATNAFHCGHPHSLVAADVPTPKGSEEDCWPGEVLQPHRGDALQSLNHEDLLQSGRLDEELQTRRTRHLHGQPCQAPLPAGTWPAAPGQAWTLGCPAPAASAHWPWPTAADQGAPPGCPAVPTPGHWPTPTGPPPAAPVQEPPPPAPGQGPPPSQGPLQWPPPPPARRAEKPPTVVIGSETLKGSSLTPDLPNSITLSPSFSSAEGESMAVALFCGSPTPYVRAGREVVNR
jgi:hypothetical protein